MGKQKEACPLHVLRSRALLGLGLFMQGENLSSWAHEADAGPQKHFTPVASWGKDLVEVQESQIRLFLCFLSLSKLLLALGCSLLGCCMEVWAQ